MRKHVWIFALLLTITSLAFASVRLAVSGIGISYGPDRASAEQDADSTAQTNLQNNCMGTLVESHKTGDQCTDNLGDDQNPKYMCTVGYVGTCQVGR